MNDASGRWNWRIAPFRRLLHEDGALLVQIGVGMAVGAGVAFAVTLLLT